jgi:hypothetical protein
MRRQQYGNDWMGGKAPRSGKTRRGRRLGDDWGRRATKSQALSEYTTKPSFVMRNGERIETYTKVLSNPTKSRGGIRKAPHKFEVQFVQLPAYWIKQLHRSNTTGTFKLAHYILVRTYECEHRGGEIVLSTEATGLSRKARFVAVRELVKLGLIEVEYRGGPTKL